ncbi:hypothetical protein IQ254_02120 [Nodosilinea sp. LEGE 07088]|nr:hypothetical protein [Nodosilinea sp. LEGE 07088]MBE9136009.1 hypothetical protein [Nodosilinea sp. LEGE 07088]
MESFLFTEANNVLSQRSPQGLAMPTQIGVWATALLTALLGLVNLWSAVTPGCPTGSPG